MRGMRCKVVAVALGISILGAFAFSGCKKQAGSGKPKVAASILPLYLLVKNISGDTLDVALVLPRGKSEHGYEPTPKEVAKLSGTKLAVLVGLDMDGWAERIIDSASGSGVTKLRLGDKVKLLAGGGEHVGEEAAEEAEHAAEGDGGAEGEHHEEHHDEHGAFDPHFWLDPLRLKELVDPLTDELVKLSPKDEAQLRKGAESTKAKLVLLDNEVKAMAEKWTKKSIVTFHGSMQYFADRYGLTIAAVIEPFPGTEPTAKYVTEVLAAIQSAKPAAIFSEPQLEAGPAKTIASQAGVPLGELDPVGGQNVVDLNDVILDIARELDKHLK